MIESNMLKIQVRKNIINGAKKGFYEEEGLHLRDDVLSQIPWMNSVESRNIKSKLHKFKMTIDVPDVESSLQYIIKYNDYKVDKGDLLKCYKLLKMLNKKTIKNEHGYDNRIGFMDLDTNTFFINKGTIHILWSDGKDYGKSYFEHEYNEIYKEIYNSIKIDTK